MTQNYTPIDDLIENSQKQQNEANLVSKLTTKRQEHVSVSKEAGPMSSKSEILPIQEVVEHEQLEQDVQPFVEVKQKNIEIPPELKKLGLQPIEKAKFKDYQNVKLPLSDDKVVLGMQAPISSSLRWLATFSMFLLQQAHLTLKVVHGKAVRIVKK